MHASVDVVKLEELECKRDAANAERDAALAELAAMKALCAERTMERDAAVAKCAALATERDNAVREQYIFLYQLEVLISNIERYCSVLRKVKSSISALHAHLGMRIAQVHILEENACVLNGELNALQKKTKTSAKKLAVFMGAFKKYERFLEEYTQEVYGVLAIVEMLNKQNNELMAECSMLNGLLQPA